jgi:hypothetical protein
MLERPAVPRGAERLFLEESFGSVRVYCTGGTKRVRAGVHIGRNCKHVQYWLNVASTQSW